MDDLNNNNNPFGEENNERKPENQTYTNPYAGTDPYSDPNGGQDRSPYAGQANQYNMPQQNAQYDPYNQPAGQAQNPYQQYQGQGYAMPQQGYQPTYQQAYGSDPYQPRPSAGMAVASLVLGIVSIVMGIFMFALPVLFLVPVIGLILGIVFKTKRLPVGKGLSTAGIITSALGLVLPVLLIIIVIMWMTSSGGTEFMRSYMEMLKETSPEQYQTYYDQLHGAFPQWFSSAAAYIGSLFRF